MASKPPPKTNCRRYGNQCVAFGCSNNGSSGLGMYTFPKDAERRLQWILQVQRTRADFVEPKNKWASLCGEHFTEDQFDRSVDLQLSMGFRAKCRGRSLLPTAIPTEFDRPGLPSPPKPRKTPDLEKKQRHNIIQELLLESERERNSVQTVAASTVTTSYAEPAGVLSDPEPGPAIKMEFVEVKLEVIEEEEGIEVPLTKANMQDFCCQFSGVSMEDFPRQFSGTMTRDFSCQFPEDGPLLLENHQLPESVTFKIENSNSLTEPPDYYSDGAADEDSETEGADEDTERDDEDFDPDDGDFEPDDESEDTDSDTSPTKEVPASSPIPPFDQRNKERKFMVFESQLRSLFDLCYHCRSKSTRVHLNVTGSILLVEQKCLDCDRDWEWKSQPYLRRHAVGNILTSAGIRSSGLSPTKILRLMQTIGLCGIALRTYTRHQSKILSQIADDIWSEEQQDKVMERVFALVEAQEDDSLDDLNDTALEGRPPVPPPKRRTYRSPNKRKAAPERVSRFKRTKAK